MYYIHNDFMDCSKFIVPLVLYEENTKSHTQSLELTLISESVWKYNIVHFNDDRVKYMVYCFQAHLIHLAFSKEVWQGVTAKP